jgi:hypothetical protein
VITKQIDALTILFNLMIIKLTVELDNSELFITNSTSMNNVKQNNNVMTESNLEQIIPNS